MSKETSRLKHITLCLFIGLLIVIAVMVYDMLTSKTWNCTKLEYNGDSYTMCEVVNR